MSKAKESNMTVKLIQTATNSIYLIQYKLIIIEMRLVNFVSLTEVTAKIGLEF